MSFSAGRGRGPPCPEGDTLVASRTAVLLILVGVVLLVGGTVFAVTFYNYTLLSLPVTSTRDVVASAILAVIGAVCVVVGVRALVRACQERGGVQQRTAQ